MRLLPAFILVLSLTTVAFGDEVDFSHDVVPILKTHCAKCHSGEKSEGGFSFNTKRLLLESGHIEPGQPQTSRLIELVESSDPDDQMPPADRKRLSPKEVRLLKKWIAAGVTWEPGFRFGTSGYEPPLLPRDVVLPPSVEGSQNPVDRILRQYYNDKKIKPLKLADDRTFLRRAWLDLVGIPPSLEEQNRFLKKDPKSRRTELIDELLARDRDYAEHWITFWNDLLRNDYAGTGYIDGGRRQITKWLYDALVNNKPYDQFVHELIAPSPESDGFINGIKWRGNVNASQVREIQFAQNVSQVFLGINMKCASCHDSFIDRWTLDEAYGLAAIYSTRELEVHRCDKPVGRVAKARWIFPEIGNVDPDAKQPERLRQLAAVMTSPKNGRFSRTIVNRLWHRLMGHGIVHPVDAMHTKPWNSDLLDYLANYLVEKKYDLKAVLRVITTSRAWQSQSAPAQDSATSEEFVFRGPIPRHLTAEQFMDSVWSLASTAPPKIQAPLPALLYYGQEMSSVEKSGKWIWTYADAIGSPAGEKAAFRKTLSLDAKPQQAAMIITCDNSYTLYVNGKRVSSDANWSTIEVADLRRHLKVGANEILIIGQNAGNSPNPAGLYAELCIVDSKGSRTRVATDETWQASRKVPKPQKPDTVEWMAAAAVTPQNFLPESAEHSIRAELSGLLDSNSRTVRASLLKSNLLTRSLGRPNREQIVTTRPASLSTLQAIDLANGEILDGILATAAKKLFPSLEDSDRFVEELFQKAICREPSADERRLASDLLGQQPTVQTVQDLIWLLVMLPEFQFVQ